MANQPISLPFDRHKLRTWRERRGLNQSALADRCEALGHKVTRYQITKIETGRNGPRPAVLAILAKALDLEIDDLLSGEREVAS